MQVSMHSGALRALLGAAAAVALAGSLGADEHVVVTQARRLAASDAQQGERHGSALAQDGDLLVVGAPAHDTAHVDDGSAYVFARAGSSWTQAAQLLAADPAANDRFGRGVALSGTTLAVGSTSQGGSAYVFVQRGTVWAQHAKLLAPEPGSPFTAMDLDLDTLVVGAPDAQNAGAVFVFVRSGTSWAHQATIPHPDPFAPFDFGTAVAVHGDTLLVGAPDDLVGSTPAGSAYVFTRQGTTWSLEQRLLSDVGAAWDGFGGSVALEGDLALVGARREDAGAPDSGAVHVFARSGTVWTREDVLAATPPAGGAEFGYSVALAGDEALVGARLAPGTQTLAGAAYLFLRAGTPWSQAARFIASDGLTGDFLGAAVATSGGSHAVGAPNAPTVLPGDPTYAQGAVYGYDTTDVPVTYCQAKTSSLGCLPFVGCNGRAQVTAGPERFRLQAFDLIPGEAAFVLYGFAKSNLAFHGGRLCVKAPLTRLLPPKTAQATGLPPCSGFAQVNFNNRIQSGVDPQLSAGQRVFAQWRQRDPADPAGFGDSLTNALRFSIAP